MDEFDKALNYIFWLSLALLFFAYWAGSTKVLETAGANLIGVIYAGTGRDSQGKFANYPQ